MLDITFEINGRKVSPNKFGDAIESAMLVKVQEYIKKSVGSTLCALHKKHPKIIVKGRNIENLSFEVHGCCEELITQAQGKLK